MQKTEIRKSACILCYVNCGIEVEIEDGLMKRVKGDKDNPKSLGYICQKAGRLPFYANDRALRLTKPLRRNAAGGFDEITWDVAFAEIAEFDFDGAGGELGHRIVARNGEMLSGRAGRCQFAPKLVRDEPNN